MTVNTKVKKRIGIVVPFDKTKIYSAIRKAAEEINDANPSDKEMTAGDIQSTVNRTVEVIKAKNLDVIDVEAIQDIVENVLMSYGFYKTAKVYILYRNRHQEQREASRRLMNLYDDLLFADSEDMDLKRDNANIDANAPMGIMLKLGTEGAKCYANHYAIPETYATAHKEHIIHIHDLDFSMITFNCLTGDSLVHVKKDGAVLNVPMSYFDSRFNPDEEKEWADVSNENLSVLSKDGEYTKLNKLLRRKHDDYIYDIVTKDGYQLSATSDHVMVITDKDGKLETKKVKDLTIGDEIPLGRYNNDMFNGKHSEINLIDEFVSDTAKIYIKNTDYINQCLPDNIKTLLELRANRYKNYKNFESMLFSLAEYKLIRNFIKNIDESKILLTTRGAKNSIPAVLKADKELGKIIGYILTEGSVNKEGLTFSNKNDEILQDFLATFNKVFNDISITKNVRQNGVMVYTMNSRLLCRLFDGVIAYKKHSNDISLSDWYLDASRDFAHGFVLSMFDGDGTLQSDGFRVKIALTSNKVIKQLRNVLTMFGIHSKYNIRESANTATVINGVSTIRNFNTYILSITGDSLNRFHEIFNESIILKGNNKRISIMRDHHRGKITAITSRPFNGYVYDFETENHLFVANGLLVHNCCQIDLGKVLSGGFSTGHGFLREPNSIRSAASLACIVIQSNQNDMYGG